MFAFLRTDRQPRRPARPPKGQSLHHLPPARLRLWTARCLAEALEPRRLLSGFAAQVNFQPASAAVPAGYIVDSGSAYGARGNGYTYGWNATNTRARDRNSSRSPDQRYDTLNFMQSNGSYTWSLAVPTGLYNVHVVAGDPTVYGSSYVYRINAEATRATNGSPTSTARWVEGTVTVGVGDGRLTLSNATGAKNNRIDFVDVTDASPTALTATPAGSQVNLAWQNNAAQPVTFQIDRSTDGATFTALATVSGVTTYADTTAQDGMHYYYRVRATNATGASDYAAADTATSLAAPTGLTATPAYNVARINLAWTGNSAHADGYQVLRSTDRTNFTTVATLPATASSYTDPALSSNTAYTYRVQAYSAAGTSPAAAATATTPNFRVFESTWFTGEPDLSVYGLQRVFTAWAGWFFTPGDTAFVQPDETACRTLARMAATAGQPVAIDIENWPMDIRYASQAQVQDSMDKFSQIITWMRDEEPGLKIGIFSFMPIAETWTITYGSDAQKQGIQSANDFLQPLARQVDFILPELYTTTDNPTDWRMRAVAQIQEARRYGKPVYPYLMVRYPDYSRFNTNQLVSPDYWRLELDTLRQYADGLVIWGGFLENWDPDAAWWQATQAFAADSPPAGVPATPAAPSSLAATASAGQVNLTWQDNSSNACGFLVERSTDGVNFGPWGVAAANANSYTDTRVTGGIYYYRVRAMTWVANSAPTAAVPAMVTRNAAATFSADAFNQQSGLDVNLYAPGAWNLEAWDNGDWVRYSGVDFGAGVSQFTAGIAAIPHYTGTIEIRLDSVTGPVIGQLAAQSTGEWHTFVPQNTTISGATGLHDVYLVGNAAGNWGVASLAWFQFAR